MTATALLAPYRSPALELPNRMVMAPMTRYRADEDGNPLSCVADYYAQRASAGLIVTEGIWPASRSQSDWRLPGIETPGHVRAWSRVTEAVHAAGGRIFAQLMPGGRRGHPLARIDGDAPLAPSAVPAEAPARLRDGSRTEPVVPRVMTLDDIAQSVRDFADAAERAMDAGFDGVELHGANSYLIHQFLADNTNLRTDAYGGTVEGRIRFALESVDAVARRIGAERTALRLAPGNPQFGMTERDPGPRYRALVDALEGRPGTRLAYLHITDNDSYPALDDLRPRWSGTLVANVGENRAPTSREAGEELIGSGRADLVSYGRAFLANPDLPERFARSAPLAQFDETYRFTHGARGYSDYPALAAGAVGGAGDGVPAPAAVVA